jgi:AbrB family looped-hinge helix DNA binding protein
MEVNQTMAKAVANVNSRGVVTIPVEVRLRLGIRPSDNVEFVYDETDGVLIRKMEYTFEDRAGMRPEVPEESPNLVKEIPKATEEAIERRLRPREE